MQGYSRISREVWVGTTTRLDLFLENKSTSCFVEVKNVTLANRRVAAFPDSVSKRGTKHLKTLIQLYRQGHRAVLVFVIQRSDCDVFRPAKEIDQEYGSWLIKAVQAGVEVLPYREKVRPQGISLEKKLPLEI